MTKPSLVHDQEEPQPQSRSRRQDKVVSIKKETKKPTRQKATKNTSVARAKTKTSLNSSLANEDAQVRITERAYELYHRRGCHHGQDLDDWLTAEREVQSEKSCS